jgi:aryl-alcohol dehydrogenase-like predicted oxidoreductase
MCGFTRERRTYVLVQRRERKSLFASFSSAKEVAFFLRSQPAAGRRVSRGEEARYMSTNPTDPADLLLITDPGERRGDMLYRPFGRTGETISAIGMGGFHLGKSAVSEAEAQRLIHEGVNRGITFMDNCWDYNNGRSELRMGVALKHAGYRRKVFLMTKIDGRTKAEAMRQIETSLVRLQTDCIDLIQHHEILRFDDPDRIFAEGGAMEAMLEARAQGKLRYIGFTGHKNPLIHLQMLDVAEARGFDYDAVQMPLNVMDAHFRSFAHLVLPRLVEKGIAVLGMKSFADSVLLKSEAPIKPIEYLHYSLNLPTSVVITGMETQRDLDQAFEAIRSFTPMDKAAVAELLGRSRPYALEGKYELFKTSSLFDGTAKNPAWLGEDSEAVTKLAPVMQ